MKYVNLANIKTLNEDGKIITVIPFEREAILADYRTKTIDFDELSLIFNKALEKTNGAVDDLWLNGHFAVFQDALQHDLSLCKTFFEKIYKNKIKMISDDAENDKRTMVYLAANYHLNNPEPTTDELYDDAWRENLYQAFTKKFLKNKGPKI